MTDRHRPPTILIVTHGNDNGSVGLVMEAVAERGGIAYRFDSDRFPTDIQLGSRYRGGEEHVSLSCDAYELDLETVSAVWYRRIAIGHRIPAAMDPQLRRAAIEQTEATVQGMIASLDGFHLDPAHCVQRAENKQLQLKIARELGLEIPRTVITNEPETVRHLAQQCPQGIVTKPLRPFAIRERGAHKVVYTNAIEAEELEHLAGLRYCPAIFQERVPKALELRTTIVGDRVFTASIDSQRSERAQTDWRRECLELIDEWEPYALPSVVEDRMLRLMRRLGLHYGAADFILTPDGRHVFLEINPAGEFFWLEKYAGLPLSGEIAALLISKRLGA